MGFKFVYYNHSYIPAIPEIPIGCQLPFRKVEASADEQNFAFFASYITEFDCSEQTDWWFTIKDSEYDLSKLNSKKRYEITKAKKFCDSKKIKPLEYEADLFEVFCKSFEGYTTVERPKNIIRKDFHNNIISMTNDKYCDVYGCFYRETERLVGFLVMYRREHIYGLTQLKTIPEYEKYNSNFSLLDAMLSDCNEQLINHTLIISNGSRTIRHQTNFNDFLEKYFGFRKAYAKLVIVYRFPFGAIVSVLRPFMRFLEKTKNPFLYNVYSVLRMDLCKYKNSK